MAIQVDVIVKSAATTASVTTESTKATADVAITGPQGPPGTGLTDSTTHWSSDRDFLPYASGAQSLGSGDYVWGEVFANTGFFNELTVSGVLNVSGDFNIGDSQTDKITTQGDLYVKDDAFFADEVVITGNTQAANIFPRAHDTYDLGSTTARWGNLYARSGHFADNTITLGVDGAKISVVSNKIQLQGNSASEGPYFVGDTYVDGGTLSTQRVDGTQFQILNTNSTNSYKFSLDDSGNLGISGYVGSDKTGVVNFSNNVSIATSGYLRVPVGTTAERPPGVFDGMVRLNTTNSQFEGYHSSNWQGLGGVIDVDRDTYVSTEKTSDDDTLYLYTAGIERAKIESNGEIKLNNNTFINNDLTVSGDLAVSGSFILGDTTADSITTHGDLKVLDDSFFADTVTVTGLAYFKSGVDIEKDLTVSGNVTASDPTQNGHLSTKSYVDSADSNLQTQITSNDADVTALQTATGSLQSQVTSNDTDISTLNTATGNLQTQITNNDTDIVGINADVTSLLNEAVRTTGNQTITGIKTFNNPAVFLSDVRVSGNIDLGDSEFDKITSKGDLYVDDAAFINTSLVVSGTATFEGAAAGITPTQDSHLTTKSYVDTVDASFQSQITANDGDIGYLQTATGDLLTRVTGNDADIAALNTATGNLQTQVTNNDGDITALQTATGSLQTQVSNNDTDISNLNTATGSLRTQVTGNDADISNLSGIAVMRSGDQSISGVKTFAHDVKILGSLGVSGDFELGDETTDKILAQGDVYVKDQISVTGNANFQGNVGIGPNIPNAPVDLYIANASTPQMRIEDTTSSVVAYSKADDSAVWFGSASNHPVKIGANNQNHMMIEPDGTISVGTSTPVQSIDIRDQVGSALFAIDRGNKLVGIGTTSPVSKFEVKQSASSEHLANFKRTDNSSTLYVSNSDKVGINTASPNKTLDVAGDISIDGIFYLNDKVRDNRGATFINQSPSNLVSDRTLTLGNTSYSSVDIYGILKAHDGIEITGAPTGINEVTSKGYVDSGDAKAVTTTDAQNISGHKTFHNDVTMLGSLGVSGNFTLGDASTDNITTKGDLFVEDDAVFSDSIAVTGVSNLQGSVGVGNIAAFGSLSYPLEIKNTLGNTEVAITAKNTSKSILYLGDTDSPSVGAITYDHSNNYLTFQTNSAERLTLDNNGNLGIGGNFSSVGTDAKLHVAGEIFANKGLTTNAKIEVARFFASRDGVNGGSLSIQARRDSADATARWTALQSMDSGGTVRSLNLNPFGGNVGIGTSAPSVSLDISSTNAVKIPVGTTAQRPSAANGMMRLNTTTNQFEGYNNSVWQGLGGVIDVDQDTYVSTEKTSDDDILFFYTAGSERARLTSAGLTTVGKVGLAGAPIHGAYNVNIAGTTALSFSSTAPVIGFTGTNAAAVITQGGASGSIELQAKTLKFNTYTGSAWTDKMTILGDGNVGIGTTTPSVQLQTTGDVIVGGNLTVSGTTFTVDTSNVLVEDPVLLLAKNQTGVSALDAGFLVERGLNTNVGFIWDESSALFTVINTNEIADDNDITIASYADFKAHSAEFAMVGIGTDSPSASLDVATTDAVKLPVGTTAQRPYNAGNGMIRLNTTTAQFEGYHNSNWQGLGGVIDVDQDTYVSTEKTSDDDTLFFYTAGSERARLTSAGLFGIGTATPGAKLDVQSTTNSEDVLLIKKTTGSSRVLVGLDSGIGLVALRNDDSATKVRLHAGGTSYFNGGSVGIGTAAPGQLLHVRKDQNTDTLVKIQNDNAGTTSRAGLWLASNSNNAYVVVADDGYTAVADWADTLVLNSNAGAGIRFACDSSTKMTLLADGKVGIGITAPTSTLHVVGTALVTSTANFNGSYTNFGGGSGGSGASIESNGRITTDYRIGIGTTTPSVQLQTTGDVIVGGNLTVSGTTFTVDTSNVLVEDPVLLLAKNQTGGAALDAGFLIERGSDTNVGFIWDESADQFAVINTTEIADDNDITIASYAAFKAGTTTLTGALAGTTATFSVSGSTPTWLKINATSGQEGRIQFQDGGASKWAIGNKGSDDSFIISAGAALTTSPKLTISSAGAATFSGVVTVNDYVHYKNGSTSSGLIGSSSKVAASNTPDADLAIRSSGAMRFIVSNDWANPKFELAASTGNATFAANIILASANGTVKSTGNLYLGTDGDDDAILITDSATTFSQAVTANAGINIDNINIDGTTIALSSSNLTLDVAGSIILDANSGEIDFKDNGVAIGRLRNVSSDFMLQSLAQDKDIIFRGNDGGVDVDALTLDMSDAGTAIFNHDIVLGDNSELQFGAGTDLKIYHDGSNSYIKTQLAGSLILDTSGPNVSITKSGSETMAKFTTNGAVELYYDNAVKLATTSTGVTVTGAVGWTGGGSANANTAYTYSQVGHLPLAGGTLTGDLTSSGDIVLGGGSTSRHYFGTKRWAEGDTSGTTLVLGEDYTTLEIRAGQTLPQSSGENLGSDANRWELFGTSGNFSGALTGTSAVFSATTNDGSVAVLKAEQAGTGRAFQVIRAVESATRQMADFVQAHASGGTEPAVHIQQTTTASDALRITSDGSTAKFAVTGTGALTGTSATFSGDLKMAATKKIYLDGGGNTYLSENSSDDVRFVVGGNTVFGIFSSGIALMGSGKRLWLDGGGDSYILENSANNIQVVAGGNTVFSFIGTGAGVPATKKLYLDGGGDTYISETSANVLSLNAATTIVTGNLTVNGTTTTIDTTNLLIDDPLMLLARTQSGTPTLDSGLIIERGGSTNVGMIWDESADEFAFINTTDTADTSGNVTIASYSPLRSAAFNATTGTFSGAVTVNNASLTMSSDHGLFMGSANAFLEGNSSGTILRFNATAGFKFTDGGTTQVAIDTNGNVGIGTTSPNTHGWADKALTIYDSSGTNKYTAVEILGKGTGYGAVLFGNQSLLRASIFGGDGSYLAFTTNSNNSGTTMTEKMRITSAGKVGIGTDSPDALLHIEGATGERVYLKIDGVGNTADAAVQFTLDDEAAAWTAGIDDTGNRFSIAEGTQLGTTDRLTILPGGNVGIGNVAPSVALDISATDAIKLPVGTTAQRPTAADGMMRLNTTTDQFEGYNNSVWQGLGGVIDVDQDTYVSTEKTSDDDTLFFYTAGGERAKIDNAGNTFISGDMTISGSLAVSGDFTLGDATTDKITTKGDLYVEDDAVFSDTIRVTGDAYFAGDVGIGTATPSVSLDIVGTDAVKLPAGTDAQRPSAAEGLIRLNTDSDRFEGYNDGNWHQLGQGTGTLASDVFAANGVLSGFALSETPNTDKDVLVSVGGVVQTPTTNYVVNSSTLNFTSIPPSGVEIEARHLNVGFIHYDDQTIPGDKIFPDDITILGDLSVSGDFTLGDATTDKITTRGDLYVEDDAYFSGDIVVNSTSEPQLTIKETDAGNDAVVLKANGSRGMLTLLNNGSSDIVLNAQANLNSYINTGGNFGIGTTAPDVRFHVQTSVADVLSKFINTDGTNGHGLLVKAGGSASGKYIATFRDAANNTRMHLLADGNVGIGTSTPSRKLYVAGHLGVANYLFGGDNEILAGQDGGGYYFATGAGQNINKPIFIGDNASYIRFKTSDAEQVRIDANGKVGIGTAAPSSKLHVGGDVDVAYGGLTLVLGANLSSTTRTNGTEKHARIGGYHDTNAEEPLAGMFLYSTDTLGQVFIGGGTSLMNAATDIKFYTAANNTTTTGTERMTIDKDGKVGIGTTAPGEKLEVVGNIYANVSDGGGVMFPSSNGIVRNSGTGVALRTNSTDRLIVDNDGKVGIGTGTTTPLSSLHIDGDRTITIGPYGGNSTGYIVGTSSITGYTNQPGTNLILKSGDGSGTGASYMAFYTSPVGSSGTALNTSVERMRILNDGNVGIGTTAPDDDLHIESATDVGIKLNRTATGGQAQVWFHEADTLKTGLTSNFNDDTFHIYHNGGNRIAIDGSGEVGIGTTAPSTKLHLADSSDVYLTLESTHASTPEEVAVKYSNFSTGTDFWWQGLNQEAAYSLAYGSAYSGSNVKLFVGTDAKVGIGTNSPEANLHIVGSGSSAWLRLDRTATNSDAGIILHTSSAETDGAWAVYMDATEQFRIADWTGSDVTRFLIDTSGRVGIGTAAPSQILHAKVTSDVCEPLFESGNNRVGLQLKAGAVGDVNWILYSGYPAAGDFAIRESGVANHVIVKKTTGNMGINMAAPGYKLDVYEASGNEIVRFSGANSGSITFRNDAANVFRIYASTSDSLGFAAGNSYNADHLTIKADGNVGIGTTTPSAKLEVNGSFAATTKSFLIDHPTKPGKKLRHGSLEGPENGVYIRGRGDNNIITLPEYWTELVDKDSITVQLTPIGKHQHIYVEKIDNNTVYIQSDEARKNTNDLEYYYLILAERKDVDKLVIEE